MTFSELLRSELSGWSRSEAAMLLLCIAIVTIASWQTDTIIGITSAVTGIIGVYLNGKGKVSTYIFALINVVLYTHISFSQKFYGMAGLHAFYYFPMNIYGLISWSRHIDTATNEVEKLRLTPKQRAIFAIFVATLTVAIGLVLTASGGNMPYIDGFITALSIVGMICTVWRFMEQWALWIVADATTTVMWIFNYQQQGGNIATVLMWATYVILGVWMFVRWHKEVQMREQAKANANQGS